MSPFESANTLPCSEESSARQAVEVLLHQFEELEHHAGAALRIGRGPGRLRRRGVRDRVLDLGVAGERHLRLHLAGIGIEHVAEAARSALDLLAADEMADLAHAVLLLPAQRRSVVPARRMA